MKIRIIGIAVIFTAILTSCAGSPVHNAFIAPGKINDTMSAWQGQNINIAISQYGPPNKVSQLSGNNYYSWGNGNGDAACQWWFETNSSDSIINSGWRGQANVCYAYVAK